MRGLACVAALLLTSASVVGCSQDEPGAEPGDESGAESTSMSISEHCSAQGVEAEAGVTVLTGDGMSLPAAEFEAASPTGTAMVLLHQTGTQGLCGWATFATQAAEAGVSSVAIDMCGYAAAECADGEETAPEEQVDVAVAHAREELAAERVVLVGASMGGSQTVVAVAGGAEVDAWADLSGPDVWEGTRLLDLAGDVQARGLPGLVAHAPDDDPRQYAAAQQLAAESGAEFLDGDSGHGYDLLNDSMGTLRPDGQALLEFVARTGV